MAKRIGSERSRLLIQDIASAEHDLLALASKHNLRLEDLGAWIAQPAHHATLTGLVLLADLQTQVLLSRYRLFAATRLIKLATSESAGEDKNLLEIARKACVELLKLDLPGARATAGLADHSDDAEQDDVLRRVLYGDQAESADAEPLASDSEDA